jgi:hypothetical protein
MSMFGALAVGGSGNLQSKLPILPFEEQIGFGPVGHLHLLGIPLQTLAGKLAGDHTEA